MTIKEASLEKEIQNIEKKIKLIVSPKLKQKSKKNQKKYIRKQRLRGQIVRARAKWIEERVKPST